MDRLPRRQLNQRLLRTVIVSGILVLTAVTVSLFLWLDRKTPSAVTTYLKEGHIYLYNADTRTSFRLTQQAHADDTLKNVSDLTAFSLDGKYVVYPDRCTVNDSATLYQRAVSHPEKKAEKLASDVTSYTAVNGDQLIFQTSSNGADALYFLSKGKKTKLESDVAAYHVSADGKRIAVLENNGSGTSSLYTLSVWKGKDKVKVASNVQELCRYNDDLTEFTYFKNNAVFRQKLGQTAEKLITNVSAVSAFFEDGTFYYAVRSQELPVYRLIRDDALEEDGSLRAPSRPEADVPVYEDYASAEEYYKAVQDYDKAAKRYNQQVQLYNFACRRIRLRNTLLQAENTLITYDLYYWNGETAKRVVQNHYQTVAQSENADTPYLLIGSLSPAEDDLLTLTDLTEQFEEAENTNDIVTHVQCAYQTHLSYHLYCHGKKVKDFSSDTHSFSLSSQGTALCYLTDNPQDPSAEQFVLQKITLKKDGIAKPVVVTDKCAFYELVGNTPLYQTTDLNISYGNEFLTKAENYYTLLWSESHNDTVAFSFQTNESSTSSLYHYFKKADGKVQALAIAQDSLTPMLDESHMTYVTQNGELFLVNRQGDDKKIADNVTHTSAHRGHNLSERASQYLLFPTESLPRTER